MYLLIFFNIYFHD